jgi:D-arabinose 1-dehydrogenase-like Zn-dependent alcohol dehydrogenase
MPLENYLELLRVHGTFIQVGAPEDKLPAFSAHALIGRGLKLGGSMIGSPAEIDEMLQLAVDKRVQAWIQTRPMDDVNEALVDMDQGKARFRYTLVNERNLKR